MTWREKEARNEVHFRAQNEWIEDASDGFGAQPAEDRMMTFVCECGDGSCSVPIELWRSEYESVRAVANQFAIALNHENPESEVVVLEDGRYAVTRKVEGVSMKIARATDPRSAQKLPPDATDEDDAGAATQSSKN